MKTAYKKIVLFALLFFMFLFIWLRYNEDNQYEKRGKELISKVEEFRNREGRLPNTISELGLIEPMNEGPYYQKKDTLHYVVFFNIGFDNLKTYYSETKKWKYEP